MIFGMPGAHRFKKPTRYHPYWTRGQHRIVRDTMDEITPTHVEDMIHGESAR